MDWLILRRNHLNKYDLLYFLCCMVNDPPLQIQTWCSCVKLWMLCLPYPPSRAILRLSLKMGFSIKPCRPPGSCCVCHSLSPLNTPVLSSCSLSIHKHTLRVKGAATGMTEILLSQSTLSHSRFYTLSLIRLLLQRSLSHSRFCILATITAKILP